MKLDIYKGILRTAGKTDEQVKESFTENVGPITQNEIDCYKKMMDTVDGLEILVTDSFYSGGDYTLITWPEKNDDAWKEFFYLAEQDPMFGTYVDEREEFNKDWEAGEYEPTGSLLFSKGDVEILEKVN